jgi:uncharacterized protein YdaU (DUF1376 family)
MKIKFVQLESDAFLTDIDFIQMSPSERGVYCSLILYLYSSSGKCEFDMQALGRLCNCQTAEEFEKIWERISKKFQVSRSGVIKHKRVTKELKKARNFRQAKSRAGLSGARKRWHSDSSQSSDSIAKERKGNVIVKERQDNISNSSSRLRAVSSSSSVRSPLSRGQGQPLSVDSQIQALNFNDALCRVIHPRTRSDRTCFHNVTNWLVDGCASGKFDADIFNRVLDYAKEARDGQKPAAVFMALMKKELGYRKQMTDDG